MNYPKNLLTVGLLLLSLNTFTAQAALFDRGNGLIYDQDRDITWLADANHAQTSGFDSDGLMSWATATAWAGGLVYQGYDDWRLPTTLLPDPTCGGQSGDNTGFNCTGSELGHLFYSELGATASHSILSGSNTANLAMFSNIQSFVYWSGTEFASNTPDAWFFDARQGYQSVVHKGSELYAWAVRSGDVAAVPIPGAVWLFGSGLLGLLELRRAKRR